MSGEEENYAEKGKICLAHVKGVAPYLAYIDMPTSMLTFLGNGKKGAMPKLNVCLPSDFSLLMISSFISRRVPTAVA